jgi:hypothetical protein
MRQRLVARAVGVLAAGNARDTVQLYSLVSAGAFAGSDASAIERVMRAAMVSAFKEFRRDAFAFALEDQPTAVQGQDRAPEGAAPGPDAGARALCDVERTELFAAVRMLDSNRPLSDIVGDLVRESWSAPWGSDLWRMVFEEPWRRLLARLYAAAYLADNSSAMSDDTMLKLRDAVAHASDAAVVGWLLLGEAPFNAPPVPHAGR